MDTLASRLLGLPLPLEVVRLETWVPPEAAGRDTWLEHPTLLRVAGAVPVVVTFLAPGAPSNDQQPPLRIEAGLSYAF